MSRQFVDFVVLWRTFRVWHYFFGHPWSQQSLQLAGPNLILQEATRAWKKAICQRLFAFLDRELRWRQIWPLMPCMAMRKRLRAQANSLCSRIVFDCIFCRSTVVQPRVRVFQCHECLIFQNQSHHWKAFRKLITDLIRTKNRLTKKAADTFRKCEKAGQSGEFGRFADFWVHARNIITSFAETNWL
jgi:hypothetical protein